PPLPAAAPRGVWGAARMPPASDSAAAGIPQPAAGSVPPEDPAAAPSTPAKRAYPAPAEVPTQQGPHGLQFDFNDGCRVVLPETERPWKVRLSDLDTGNVLFATELKAGRVNSTKRYFVRFRVAAWQREESV